MCWDSVSVWAHIKTSTRSFLCIVIFGHLFLIWDFSYHCVHFPLQPNNSVCAVIFSIRFFLSAYFDSKWKPAWSLTVSHCNRCFECNEELSTHCNKKALAQTLDFLQKHSAKATSGEVQLSGALLMLSWVVIRESIRPKCNFTNATYLAVLPVC